MDNKVYFGNSVADIVSVNLNSALSNQILQKRKLSNNESGDSELIELSSASYPIQSNIAKGKFSNSDANRIVIYFDTLKRDDNIFDVTIDDSKKGSDLYFYVFFDTLFGQDSTGRSSGIKIEKLEIVKRKIQ